MAGANLPKHVDHRQNQKWGECRSQLSGQGTTTVVDVSTGWPMIDGLRKYVINTSNTRVYALLGIGMLGDVSNYRVMGNLAWVNPELTAKAAKGKQGGCGRNCSLSGGTFPGHNGLGIGMSQKDIAGCRRLSPTLPMMVRYHNLLSPLPLILKIMRKGDVFAHIYNREPVGILDANGKILPEVREARQRGVLFDVGRGLAHFVYAEVDKCLQQDFLPDTISTTLVAPHAFKSYEVSTDLPSSETAGTCTKGR